MKFQGHAVTGMGLARKIGFPTVNLEVPSLELEYGVYAVLARIAEPVSAVSDSWLPALMHYGPKPTVSAEKIFCEIHFLDYPLDGSPVELEIETVGWIRGVVKFDGLESLKSQIASDEVYAREHYFAL